MIGAEPRTQWVRGLVKLNDRGFILTGRTFPRAHDRCPVHPCRSRRACRAYFAAGDVQYGSVKRAAGAVGEGRPGQIPVSESTRVCRWPVAWLDE